MKKEDREFWEYFASKHIRVIDGEECYVFNKAAMVVFFNELIGRAIYNSVPKK